MAEYIEREELVRQIICNMAEFIGAPDDVLKHDEQCNYAIFCVESAPAADVAPVVRCRDCANFRQNVRGGCWCDEYGGAITPEDYCSRAVTDKPSRVKIPWEAD